MARNKSANKETARRQRRQQQRETPVAPAPLPVETLKPWAPPPELLGPSVLVPVLCSCIVLGCMLYHIPGLATPKGNELSWPQPLFTAVNAATLTGFQQARNPNDYTTAGQFLTLFLTLVGMMFSFICGGVAVMRIARLQFRDWQLMAAAGGAIFASAIVGGIGLYGTGRDFWQGAFQGISAFGNSGLALGRLPEGNRSQTMLVVLPLTVLGGLGIPVLMELIWLIRRPARLSIHSRTVLIWSAGVYLSLAILLLLVRLPVSIGDLKSLLSDSVRQSINSRSAGFAFEFASALPPATTFILVLAMVIGAGPGGSGGGIKVTTLSVLSTGTRDCLAGRAPGRRFATAIVWVGVYLALLVIATIALLITNPEIHLDRTLFLAASALGNVGLSHNALDASAPNGMYVLSAAMLVGRVAPALMLWYLIDTTPDAVVAVG